MYGACQPSDWFLDDSWGLDKSTTYSTQAGVVVVVIETDHG
jgi:hypothetical protein